MELPEKLLKVLDEVEKDCLRLKRRGNLMEYGKGQLDLIRIIRKLDQNPLTSSFII